MVDSFGKEVGSDVGLTGDANEVKRARVSADMAAGAASAGSSADTAAAPGGSEALLSPLPPLRIELWTRTAPDDSEGVPRITKKRVMCGSALPDPALFLRDGGVSFGLLFQWVLELCVENRLRVLHHRLLKTPEMNVYCTHGMVIEQEPGRVLLSAGCTVMAVTVDARTGRFALCTSQMGGNKAASRAAASFLSELNNVSSERYAHEAHILCDASGAASAALPSLHLPPITTSAGVAMHIVSARLADAVRRLLCVTANEADAATVFAQSRQLLRDVDRSSEARVQPGQEVPLLFELCTWRGMSLDLTQAATAGRTNGLSEACFEAITSHLSSATATAASTAPPSVPVSTSATATATTTMTILKPSHVDNGRLDRSLLLCLWTDPLTLQISALAALADRPAGAFLFAPYLVRKALALDLGAGVGADADTSRSRCAIRSLLADGDHFTTLVGRATSTAYSWATQSNITRPLHWQAFGLSSERVASGGEDEGQAGAEQTFVLWADASTLVLLVLDVSTSTSSSALDQRCPGLKLSLLAPLPLAGIGSVNMATTFTTRGNAPCVPRMPRELPPDIAARLLQRCAQLGDFHLAVAAPAPDAALYQLHCTRFDPPKALGWSTSSSGDLYATLVEDMLQALMATRPFPREPEGPSSSSSSWVSTLCDSVAILRPVYEFLWMLAKHAATLASACSGMYVLNVVTADIANGRPRLVCGLYFTAQPNQLLAMIDVNIGEDGLVFTPSGATATTTVAPAQLATLRTDSCRECFTGEWTATTTPSSDERRSAGHAYVTFVNTLAAAVVRQAG